MLSLSPMKLTACFKRDGSAVWIAVAATYPRWSEWALTRRSYPVVSSCRGPFSFAQANEHDPEGSYDRMAAAWLDDDCPGAEAWVCRKHNRALGVGGVAYFFLSAPFDQCAESARPADLDQGEWIAHLSEGR